MRIPQTIPRVYSILCFLVIAAVSLWLSGDFHALERAPYGVHQWRQTDVYSQALNYYHEGMKFLEPQIHFQHAQGHGVGEFPILPYLTAGIWQMTGQNPVTGRYLSLFIGLGFFAALFLFTARRFGIHYASALFILFFFSPIVAYYATNYLPNFSGLALMGLAMISMIKYFEGSKQVWFWFSIAASLAAALLRVTMLYAFAPFYLIWFLEQVSSLRFGKFNTRFFERPWGKLAGLCLPVLGVGAWYFWAKAYNASYDSIYFLTKIKPIWQSQDLTQDFLHGSRHFIEGVYGFPVWILFAIFLGAILFQWKKLPLAFRLWLPVSTLGFAAYLILWFTHLSHHDYYFLEAHLLLLPIALAGMWSCLRLEVKPWVIWVGISVFLLYGVGYGTVRNRIKYMDQPWLYKQGWALRGYEVRQFRFQHFQYRTYKEPLERIQPYLRSIGIERDEIVISYPDPSPNITLSFMDQKGFTNLYQGTGPKQERMEVLIGRGARYFIVSHPNELDIPELQPYMQNQIGAFEHIRIFDLQGLGENPTVGKEHIE